MVRLGSLALVSLLPSDGAWMKILVVMRPEIHKSLKYGLNVKSEFFNERREEEWK